MRFPTPSAPYFTPPASPMLKAEIENLLPKLDRLPPDDSPRLPEQLKQDVLIITKRD